MSNTKQTTTHAVCGTRGTTRAAGRLALQLVLWGGIALLAGCAGTRAAAPATEGAAGGDAGLHWPQPERSAWLPEGTFPNVENLRKIGPGLNKDQLYALIDKPHFREGVAGVREWDYVFNFRTPAGVTRCQYKIQFDAGMRAEHFHWLPASCAEFLAEPAPRVVERAAPPAEPPMRRLELSADALFAFGRSGEADLSERGRSQLDGAASQLRQARRIHSITVVGHTDRLGGEAYNQRLSLARATSVRDYLRQRGVRAASFDAIGAGEGQPKVQCTQSEARERAALIDCLAPNRRVEVRFSIDG